MAKKDACEKLVFWGQHGATCWFNSILMSLFYSQRSRNLVLDKLEYRLVNTKILKTFKHILHHKILKSKQAEKDIDFFNKIKPETILQMLYDYDNLIFPLSDFSVGFIPQLYIKPLYYLFDIDCMMFKKINSKQVVYNSANHISSFETDENGFVIFFPTEMSEEFVKDRLKENPEVIILECNAVDSYERRNKKWYVKNSHYFLSKDQTKSLLSMKETIKWNDQWYDLDSVILANWNVKDDELSHTITGLTCNQKKYVYNGWTTNTVDPAIKKKLTDLKTPCDLMKFDWNIKKHVPFCLNVKQCKLDIIKTVKSDPCFSFHKGNRLLIYIKQKTNIRNISSKTPEYVSYEKDIKKPKRISKEKAQDKMSKKRKQFS